MGDGVGLGWNAIGVDGVDVCEYPHDGLLQPHKICYNLFRQI